MTILRGKLLNYDANWLRDAIPSKHYKLSKKMVDSILEAPDFEHALIEVTKTPYGKYFVKKENPEQTLATAEKAFDGEIFKHAQLSRIKELFNIGLTLGFLTQKQFEVYNLVVASLCVEASWSPEKTQQAMIFSS
jgi:vacuolar-type H+-ATPase subunit C/Vma6